MKTQCSLNYQGPMSTTLNSDVQHKRL